MYKHILIPSDGSEPSARAVQQGVGIARAMGARVTGLFVAPAPTPLIFKGLAPVRHVQPEQHAELSRQAAARCLGDIEGAARDAGVEYQGVAIEGEYPADAILEIAAKHQCDLIVMASHGRRGIVSALLGSETRRVLAQAEVPVLVCR
jgi:nucleotide-binding universal stress UspA family protein